jgi:hypothetical protein
VSEQGRWCRSPTGHPSPSDYLATLVAKEYVMFNHRRSTSEELGEEMVRMLVRVRRHLRKRR